MHRANPLWDATLDFLRQELPKPPATVLEVGCGRGEVARELTKRGYAVVPIDSDRRAIASARRQGVPAIEADLLSYHGGPFDACICVYSFHHLLPLPAAVGRIRSLLKPDGRLLVNDYAWEEADEPTASWMYDCLGALVSAGVARARWGLPSSDQSPLALWRAQHNKRLTGETEHRGREMVRAIRARLVVEKMERTPYAYASIGGGVRGSRRIAVARQLMRIEKRRLREGLLRPLGLRVVAKVPGHA